MPQKKTVQPFERATLTQVDPHTCFTYNTPLFPSEVKKPYMLFKIKLVSQMRNLS